MLAAGQALGHVEVEKLVKRLRDMDAPRREAQVERPTAKRGLGWIAERVKKLVGGQGFDTGRSGTPPAMADPEGSAELKQEAGEN